MKLFKSILFTFLIITIVASCTRRPHTSDIVEGTPTSADSALAPSKHEPFTAEQIEQHEQTVPTSYKR